MCLYASGLQVGYESASGNPVDSNPAVELCENSQKPAASLYLDREF